MNALDPAIDWRTNMRSVRLTRHAKKYSRWNRKKTTLFSRYYLPNRSTSDIGVFGYIGVLWLKEHSPEAWHIIPRTPCIFCIRQIIERKYEHYEAIHQLFINFKKAHYSFRREVLCNIYIDFGIPVKLVRLTKICLNGIFKSPGR
jgi:hypothetical protein